MSYKKYLKGIEMLKTDNLQTEIWSLNIKDPALKEKLRDICKRLTIKSENYKRILGDIILDTIEGNIDDSEYSILRRLMQENIENTMVDIRKAAEKAYEVGNIGIYNFLIELLVSLHTSMLKYTPAYSEVNEAATELYLSDTLDSVKEQLYSAISKWEDAELTFRGAHAMLPKENYLNSYFKYNRRRIDNSRFFLESTIETSKPYLESSPYMKTASETFLKTSIDPKTGFFSTLETKTEDEFTRELQRLQKLLVTESQKIANHQRDKMTIRVRIDESLGIIEALKTRDPELGELYDKASSIFKDSFDLENNVIHAGKEAKEYVSCLFADEQTIRRIKLHRELSDSPKSVEETFSITLFQMKIYSIIKFLLGSVTIYADLKVINILEQTGHYGSDKWGILLSVLSSFVASIIGYKALKSLSDSLKMIPYIYRLQLEHEHTERRL